MSTWDNYLDVLLRRLAPYYDVYKNETIAGKNLDLFARFKMRNEKYFFTKSVTLFAYENHELVLIKKIKEVTLAEAEQFCAYIEKAVAELAQPGDEHMSTVVTGVLVATDNITPEGRRIIERFRYARSFKFLLQGWCQARLLAVDLTAHEVYTNKSGRAVKEAYCPPVRKGAQEGTLPASTYSVSG
ncbi:MAG: hypothetical protein ACOYEO_06510 [bacterium]|jgi:hypothetical protein